jgi:WXG100 family type VII secretion target
VADKTKADYEQLSVIARRFEAESNTVATMLQTLRGRMNVLQNGAWVGQAATEFLAEMSEAVLPSLDRLSLALTSAASATRTISAMIKAAEDAAARILCGESVGETATAVSGDAVATNVGGSNPTTTGTATSPLNVPVPRIYVINGINNDGRGQPDIARYLNDRGYPGGEVKLITGVFDTYLQKYVATARAKTNAFLDRFGLDWMKQASNVAFDLTDHAVGLTNTMVGVVEVAREYVTGGNSLHDVTMRQIDADLRANPLAPGQQVIFMSHSGGGILATNAAPALEGVMVTRTDGSVEAIDVKAVVTLGSPVINYDRASVVAPVYSYENAGDHVVNHVTLRSDEARWLLVPSIRLLHRMPTLAPILVPGMFMFDRVARNPGGSDTIQIDAGNNGGETGHGGYWTSNEVWSDLVRKGVVTP